MPAAERSTTDFVVCEALLGVFATFGARLQLRPWMARARRAWLARRMIAERFSLDALTVVEYRAGWLDAGDASALLDDLTRSARWEQRAVVLHGRSILQPRLVGWAGDLPYRYSGQTLEPRSWSARLEALRAAVVRETGVAFNHALLNHYRDGDDSMGFHSDDEPELGDDPLVATVSLGAERRLVFRSKKKSEARRAPPRLVLEPGHGSLVVMGHGCQKRFRHGVPRQPGSGPRISVTFRQLLRAPAGRAL